MSLGDIEKKLKSIIEHHKKDHFIFELLAAYNLPKSSIARLQKGPLNLSKDPSAVLWKKKVFFNAPLQGDLHSTIDQYKHNSSIAKQHPRFLIVTDFHLLLAVDTKTQESLDIPFTDLPKHYAFFLPWAGIEKARYRDENPADIKAAEKMAKLFDEIKKDNPQTDPNFIHGLNVFLSRLLFCFFAEDTHIFKKNQFTNSLGSHTKTDGSDLKAYFEHLFQVLNTPNDARTNLPAHFDGFPYVNGGLFKDSFALPLFTASSRRAILDCGQLDWADINPDIFGSMIQAVVTPEMRGGMGMHYTSVPNIMKVIEPLFLNELYDAFEQAKGSVKKLEALQSRLSKLKIFDPACGSGNFLIIAYKELRKLEMAIIQEIGKFNFSEISLNQFYGIEIDDFAHEIAMLSLWLAEHQMNVVFDRTFGKTTPSLPLKASGHIVCANACRVEWEEVCPKQDGDEIYIMGNPPYLGARLQDSDQKADMQLVFEDNIIYKDLDYISCWFLIATRYIHLSNAKFAFVSTNSISQGEQVGHLWGILTKYEVEIFMAYPSFKWGNSAKGNAGVTCVIVGVRNKAQGKKKLFVNLKAHLVENISPYLADGNSILIETSKHMISHDFPPMMMGNMARDGGHLILSELERNNLLYNFPDSKKFIRPLYGSVEFIQGKKRWCLWIDSLSRSLAESIPEIKERIEKVYLFRVSSKAKTTNGYAKTPYMFAQCAHKETQSIIVPRVSSENRLYIPVGFLDERSIISDSALAIYNAEPWHMSVLTSKMHMVWVRTVAGRLKTDYRYSSSLCYNTFPFPKITQTQKDALNVCVDRILEERERHPGKTLAQLYDPNKMPDGLREAHRLNDDAIERCYRSKSFENDDERLAYLFKLYERMIAEEKRKAKEKS
ncbi:MAG: class I SAM-dependent DNA methyltransferase [Desulfobacteraceae bacterium]|nr:class I SAM-dependent DNA methyltransferase [Desulfobacteraceae bacterium]